jgi:hypothetical protein
MNQKGHGELKVAILKLHDNRKLRYFSLLDIPEVSNDLNGISILSYRMLTLESRLTFSILMPTFTVD